MVKHNHLAHLVTEAPRGPRQIVRPSPCNQIHRAHIDQLANQMSERRPLQSHQWLQEIYCHNPSSSQLMCLVWNLVTCWIHLVGLLLDFVCTQSSKASNKAFLWTQSNEQTPSVRPSALPSKAAKKAEAAGPTTTPSWEALALFRYKIISLDWGLHVNTLHVLGIQSIELRYQAL